MATTKRNPIIWKEDEETKLKIEFKKYFKRAEIPSVDDIRKLFKKKDKKFEEKG